MRSDCRRGRLINNCLNGEVCKSPWQGRYASNHPHVTIPFYRDGVLRGKTSLRLFQQPLRGRREQPDAETKVQLR